jgi:hypothetical protein
MCYICAPNQFKFYGKERLTVCKEYCDLMFNACGDAILKGSRINTIYSNGTEFCKSRRYNLGSLENDNCFFYNIELKTISAASRHRSSLLLLVSYFSTQSYCLSTIFFLVERLLYAFLGYILMILIF